MLCLFYRKRNRNRKNSVKAEQSTQNGAVEETTLPSTISIQVSVLFYLLEFKLLILTTIIKITKLIFIHYVFLLKRSLLEQYTNGSDFYY